MRVNKWWIHFCNTVYVCDTLYKLQFSAFCLKQETDIFSFSFIPKLSEFCWKSVIDETLQQMSVRLKHSVWLVFISELLICTHIAKRISAQDARIIPAPRGEPAVSRIKRCAARKRVVLKRSEESYYISNFDVRETSPSPFLTFAQVKVNHLYVLKRKWAREDNQATARSQMAASAVLPSDWRALFCLILFISFYTDGTIIRGNLPEQ